MASDPTSPPGPPASSPSQTPSSGAAAQAPPMSSSPPSPVPNSSQASTGGAAAQASPAADQSASLPDPFASDPFQNPASADTASTSPADNSPASLPDPFASDPFQTSAGGAPASSGISSPQTGVWFNAPDPQYLIQWSLQEVQEPQLSASSASQAAPPTTYKARARIFQEVFETTVAAARPVVPFSLRDATTGSLCLQGSLVLLQQPSDPPVLLVKNLKFSGFQQAQVVLFPSAPDAPGGGSAGS